MIGKITTYVKNAFVRDDEDYRHIFRLEFPREYRYHLKMFGEVSRETAKNYVLNNNDEY